MISIVQEPQRYSPSNNKQIFTFSGDTTALDGYEYIVDIYPATGTTLISRNFVPKYPQSAFGVFNSNKIIKDLILNNDVLELSTNPIPAPNSFYDYKIELGETFQYWSYDDYYFTSGAKTTFSATTQQHNFEVGDEVIIAHDSTLFFPQYSGLFIVDAVPDSLSITINTPFESGPTFGGLVKYSNNDPIDIFGIVTSSTITSYIGAFNENDYISYDDEDYIIFYGAGLKNISSNVPEQFNIDEDAHFLLYAPSFSGSPAIGYYLQTRDNANNILGTYKVKWSGGTEPTGPAYFPIGPEDLASLEPQYITVLGGQSNIITDDVDFYYFFLIDTVETGLTELRRFNITRNCTKYGKFQLLFQDRLGSFGSFNFDLKRNEELGIKRTFFNRMTGVFNPTTGVYTDEYYDYGLKSLDVSSNEEFTLRIKLDNENDSQYFKDLLVSKTIYYVDRNYQNALVPIIIKDGTYDIPDDTVSEIFYEIKIAMAKNVNVL